MIIPSKAIPSRLLVCCLRRLASGTPGMNVQNHYQALGLEKSASTKEIKTAFYELSKKHHPDANPNSDTKSAEQFQKIVAAYEILGSEDKKREYDSELRRGKYETIVIRPTQQRQKQYTDLDIDYKDFEHFQRSNRRRRVYYNEFEMPQYFRNVNWTEDSAKAKAPFSDQAKFANFKEDRAYKREMEEKRLLVEMMELQRRQKYPLPDFEKLSRRGEKEKERKNTRNRLIAIVVIIVCTVLSNYIRFL